MNPANEIYKLIGNYFSPAGQNARLSIFIFHRVLAEQDPIFPREATAESFDSQIACLKAVFNMLPLAEAVTRLKAGTLPERPACITFDDGYADNVTLALPILKKHGVHATFFIATGYLNGGRMFNDTVIEAFRNSRGNEIELDTLGLERYDVSTPPAKRKAIIDVLSKLKYMPLGEREEKAAQLAAAVSDVPPANDLMMTTAQLRELHHAGMGIGGHTVRHPILAKLDATAVHNEIAEGKEFLEETLGERVSLFAYPNGRPGADYLPEQADIVRKIGFDAAVSTQQGVSSRSTDVFQLPRFTPWQANSSRFILAALQNLRRSV